MTKVDRGDAIYEAEIRPQLKAVDKGKFLAIDIETGQYELAANELTACDRLRARIPQAPTRLVRVGFPYVHRFGPRALQNWPRMKHRCT